jgi:ankyrin repeat protein
MAEKREHPTRAQVLLAYRGVLNSYLAEGDDPDAVRRMLALGADPDRMRRPTAKNPRVPHEETVTALMLAARHGRELSLDVLLPRSRIDAVDRQGRSALGHACSYGQLACAKKLLAAGASPAPHGQKWSLLSVSVSQGREDIFNLLAPLGGAGDRDAEGRAPLALAAAAGLPDFVQTLLSHGADANAVDLRGYTALMHAVEYGQIDCVRTLIPASDLELRDYFGLRAIDHAAGAGRPEPLRLLLGVSSPNSTDFSGTDTLMHAAARAQDLQCIDLLLPHCDPRRANAKGWTALAFAADNGSEAIVKRLLPLSDAGARTGASRRGPRPEELARKKGVPQLAAQIQAFREAQELRETLSRRPKAKKRAGAPAGPSLSGDAEPRPERSQALAVRKPRSL